MEKRDVLTLVRDVLGAGYQISVYDEMNKLLLNVNAYADALQERTR